MCHRAFVGRPLVKGVLEEGLPGDGLAGDRHGQPMLGGVARMGANDPEIIRAHFPEPGSDGSRFEAFASRPIVAEARYGDQPSQHETNEHCQDWRQQPEG